MAKFKKLAAIAVATIILNSGAIGGEKFVDSNSECDNLKGSCLTAEITVGVPDFVEMLKQVGMTYVTKEDLYKINGWSESATMIKAGTRIRFL